MKINKQTKGFTIIEVVLVLAIAGLIFMMVFIALPALQRSQRDAQRKNDLSRLNTALSSYQSNNRGSLPTNWNTFVSKYVTLGTVDTFVDPSGTDYSVTDTGSLPSNFTADTPVILVTPGSVCGKTEDALSPNQGTRKVAFQMKLEGSGIACASN